MDLSHPAFTYALLIIPTLFAVTIIGQGINKISNDEPDGKGTVGFGIFLLVLIAVGYIFFIR